MIVFMIYYLPMIICLAGTALTIYERSGRFLQSKDIIVFIILSCVISFIPVINIFYMVFTLDEINEEGTFRSKRK